MNFLEKSYDAWIKVEKSTIIPVSYQGLDDYEEVKIVLIDNENNYNYYNVVSDSAHDNEVKEKFLKTRCKIKLKWPPRPCLIQSVACMKNLQAFYNEDANKIVEQVAEKN